MAKSYMERCLVWTEKRLASRDEEIAELKVVSDHNLKVYQEAASKMRAEIAEMTKYANKRNTAALDAEEQVTQFREQLAAANTLIRAYREEFGKVGVSWKIAATEPKP